MGCRRTFFFFTNIHHNEGLHTLQVQLDERTQPKVPSHYIIKLMELVLRHNIFTFHDSYWKQEVGAAMGSKPVPHYADTFMARTVDPEITNLAHKFDTNEQKVMQLLKKFLDDYFSIFNGSTKNLHLLWDEMNKIHPSIKLTMNHTSILGENIEDKCDCKEAYEIPFLDTLCSIKNE